MKRDTVHIGHKFENDKPEMIVLSGEHLQYEARLATALIERWGMVMGAVDGEDSAGRQKLALMSPEDVVARACDSAALAMKEFRNRGWILEVPTIDEARKILAERDDVDDDDPKPKGKSKKRFR